MATGSSGSGESVGTANKDNPYADNRTVTGRYDLTYAGDPLEDAYYTPIGYTDVTVINEPEEFCRLMSLHCYPNEDYNPGTIWHIDWPKPVTDSGVSNIYRVDNIRGSGDFRNQLEGHYKIEKVSKARPFDANQGYSIYELRVYGFENGYLLVNTTRNGIYFNERGEAVVNGPS